MPMLSPSVGCGWMVLPMSTPSAPISIASATSLIRSPACVPTMPPPTMRCVSSLKSSLVKPSSRAVGDRAARRRPREQALLDLDALGLGLVLGQADPGDLGVGVGDARDHARVERRLAVAAPRTSAATCASCTALCASIGWPTMSPIAKMCGTLVRICMSTGMKPRSPTATPAFSAPMLLAVRHAADGLQHQVVDLLLQRALALELDEDAVLRRLGADGLGLQHDVVEARRVHLLPDPHEVAVGALHQAVEHLDDVQARAQRRVHRAHLQADDAAADDQHALGVLAQFERAGAR